MRSAIPLALPPARLTLRRKARKGPKIIFYRSVTAGQTRSVAAPRGNPSVQVARNRVGSDGVDARVTPDSQNLPLAGSAPTGAGPLAQDKPRVERTVQFVRENFWRGESFTDLVQAQHRVEVWCRTTAGLRVHGTTAQRPAEHFAAVELPPLLPAPAGRYDVPIFATPKAARDLHVEVARGLYSVPGELIGQRVEVRADTHLVKVFNRGQLIKTPPRVRPGGRSTDPADYPVGRADYALRDVASLTAKAPGYDARYVALAEHLDCELITADGRLARATAASSEVV